MLKVKGLYAYYGEIEALHGVDIEVPDKKICCVIGANGAGKTTLLNSISGMVKRKGSIMWDDEEIIGRRPNGIGKLGITQVPEGRMVFPGLNVYQNLEMGTVSWHGFFGKESYEEDIERIFALFPRLRERKNQMAWSLSGGEQQMLAIGRGLMARPKLLMLDEPSMGLAPLVVEDLFSKIKEINEMGITILLIEQNANLALETADKAYIMERGNVILHGDAKELRSDERVLSAYLGNFAKARPN